MAVAGGASLSAGPRVAPDSGAAVTRSGMPSGRRAPGLGNGPSSFQVDPGRAGSRSTITSPTAERMRPNIRPTRSVYPLRSASQAEEAAETSQMKSR